MANSAYTFWGRHRYEISLFSAAFFLRIALFAILSYIAVSQGVLSSNPAKYQYPIIGSDAGGYVSTAHVFLAEGRFASLGSVDSQSYMMPGYPFLLAVIFFLGGGVKSMVLLQAVLAGFSTVFIYRIGKEITSVVGSIAAWMFVFDPISIFYATTILTETVFIFFTLAAAYLFLRWFSDAWWKMIFVGILVGLSVYIRPNAVVFPFVFGTVLLLFRDLSWSWRQALGRGAVLAVAAYLVVFPWMLRNKLIFNTWELTAVATIQWYWYNAPLYYAQTHGITHTEALDIFRARLYEINPYQSDAGTLRNAPYMRQVAFEYLREDPVGYAWFHVVKSAPFFVSDGLRDIARRMELVGEQPNIGSALLRGDIRGVVRFFSEHTRAAFLLIVGSMLWGFVTLGFLISLWLGRVLPFPGRRALYVSIGLIIVTMLIAAGPNANARYRLTVAPFLFIATAYGYIRLTELINYRTLHSHESR